jgi:hypothetical protein
MNGGALLATDLLGHELVHDVPNQGLLRLGHFGLTCGVFLRLLLRETRFPFGD